MGEEKKAEAEEKELTPEKAKELLAKERRARIQRCRQKIEQALAEENCLLDCSILVTGTGNIPQVQIRPKPENE